MAEPATLSTSPIRAAVAAGHAALAVSGNVFDYRIIGDDVGYQPQLLADDLHDDGYLVIRYSKAQGGHIHRYSSLAPNDKESVDARLSAVGLLPLLRRENQAPDEARAFFRAIPRVLQTPAGHAKPIACIVDYAEHLAPAVQTAAAASDDQTFAAETIHGLANSPALRKSGNLFVCVLREGFQNTLLNDLCRVDLPYPTEADSKAFLEALLKRQETYARLESGLTAADVARLTRGLRLRDLEAMLREARSEHMSLTRDRVLAAKATGILRASEGTLSVMTSALTLDDIIGLDAAKRFFGCVAAALRAGDPTSPRAILMTGPFGTAKSTFPPILGTMCGFNTLQFHTIKNMFVGESERRLNLALSLCEQLAPTILFTDEATESLPSRNIGASDGGVSLDILAQLFKFSARDDLRGRVLLLAATNVPERLDPAWHDRFVIIPFLELLPQDMCRLLPAFERRTTGQATLDAADPRIVEACKLLHTKGASPRKLLDVLNHALLASGHRVSPDAVLAAARDYIGSANPMAVAYSSLVSISLTSFRSYFPWSLDPANYAFPWYLEGLVDKGTGEIDRQELQKRIQEYRKWTTF